MSRRIGEYCLVCFHTLDRDAQDCSSCGHPVRAFERRKYWSLHPAHVRAQKRLIQLAILLTLAIQAVFLIEVRGWGRGVGYALAMPWFGAVFLVFLATHITQHMTAARASVALGILPFMAAVVLLDGEIVWGAAFALATVIPVLIRMSFRTWKAGWVSGARLEGEMPGRSFNKL